MCGDKYVSSYSQGALLTMSINISFRSHCEKTEFEAKATGKYGDIVSASAGIQKIATQYKIEGSVSIQAYQKGGEPNQLANILSKDASGDYYALTCSLEAMDNFTKAASGLLDYAKNDFSTQFSFENNTGLTPLGIGFIKYMPIEYIGLAPTATLVTDDVIATRKELTKSLDEAKYYK